MHEYEPPSVDAVRREGRRGRSLLLDPRTNKGTAFTLEEREALGLLGLLPPAISTIEQQLERAYENFRAAPDDLAKYVHLAALHDRNEVLFFRLLLEHLEEMMPIVYTPTVGLACQRFSHIYRRARGLYVTLRHRGRIVDVLRNAEVRAPSVIVVTDGERILGLGDQGAGGMGIPIGKSCLYTLCAGIPPWTTIPVMLDVGTDNEERLADPLYLGIRRHRVRGEEYQSFVDEFVEAVRTVYPDAILQWEDFLKENALLQLERFRDRLPTFNDDIQGTAAVVLAGLFAAMRVTGGRLADQRLLIAGAGASAQGIANLFVAALREEGLGEAEAKRRIWMVDRRGLVLDDRPGLEGFKRSFARSREELGGGSFRDPSAISLPEAVAHVRPTILLGTSATPGLFTEEVVRTMAEFVARPVIFPLSNPTSKAECTPADALRWTDGRALIATGSPFEPVDLAGRRHRIGQCNNSFIFPGFGLGAWVGRVRRIHDGLFLAAARALARCVGPEDLAAGALFPALGDVREVSASVALATLRQAVADGLARVPADADLERLVRDAMWFPDYPTLLPAGGAGA
ncbi:MAG: NAD-dependent malic enzyme [Acidobacteria bacterium]|nr:MAG: NAD-dependent malic enzyme [Acidobacteriota bacterium]